MIIELDDIEFATVLDALRRYQQDVRECDEKDYERHKALTWNCDAEVLSNDEIGALCERINTDGAPMLRDHVGRIARVLIYGDIYDVDTPCNDLCDMVLGSSLLDEAAGAVDDSEEAFFIPEEGGMGERYACKACALKLLEKYDSDQMYPDYPPCDVLTCSECGGPLLTVPAK